MMSTKISKRKLSMHRNNREIALRKCSTQFEKFDGREFRLPFNSAPIGFGVISVSVLAQEFLYVQHFVAASIARLEQQTTAGLRDQRNDENSPVSHQHRSQIGRGEKRVTQLSRQVDATPRYRHARMRNGRSASIDFSLHGHEYARVCVRSPPRPPHRQRA